MQKIFKTITISAFIMFVVLLGVGLFQPSQKVLAQSGGTNYITKMNYSLGVSVGSTSTSLLPASSGRVYAIIVNDGSAPVYLSLNGSAAVANAGVRLNGAGGSYEINFENQYVGAINAITASGTSNVTVSAAQ